MSNKILSETQIEHIFQSSRSEEKIHKTNRPKIKYSVQDLGLQFHWRCLFSHKRKRPNSSNTIITTTKKKHDR